MEQVYITKAAGFLPNAPVANEEMEDFLGKVGGVPSRARQIVLRRNGIKTRHYALDREGHVTHTNVQMAAESIKRLEHEGFTLEDIDVLACGTASPEQLVPSHGVMVHGALGVKRNMEVVSFAGSCCTGVDALKYAYMSVLTGAAKNAVASASERLSAWMRASYFQSEADYLQRLDREPILAFEKEFLRWMLSDGAFALLVQPKPAERGLSLRIDWIDITSYANEKETCMYAGGEKDAEGNLQGWTMFDENEWLSRSLFAVRQDTRLLGDNIVKLGGRYMADMAKKHHFTADDIDWYMPHLSSMFFKDKILEEMKRVDLYVPEERWFLNLPRVGNIASASAFAMIEEAMRSGRLRNGQHILMMIPESARFSYCYCMLTVEDRG